MSPHEINICQVHYICTHKQQKNGNKIEKNITCNSIKTQIARYKSKKDVVIFYTENYKISTRETEDLNTLGNIPC